jgi:choline-sulfatase
LQKLEDFGLIDDTVIVACSDHGDMLGDRGMVQKRVFYEPSANVHLSFTFPRNFPLGKPGTVCSDPVSLVDVTATILELAGVKDALPMDGRSLLPQLQGDSDPDRYVFSESHAEGVTTSCFMVRKGRYKYTYIHEGDGQLFDLAEDPEEWNNLCGKPEHAEVEKELRELILQRFDPKRVNREVQESVERRQVLKRAHEAIGKPSWNYRPAPDVDHMYAR